MFQNIFITSKNDFESPTVHVFDDKKGHLTFPWDDFNYAYVRDNKGSHISIYGHRLKKVYFYSKDSFDIFESDLPRETRVLTDLYLDDDEPSSGHTVLTFDIEVDIKNGLPDIENAANEIISIASYDDASKEYHSFTIGKTRMDTSLRGWQEHYYVDEIELLNAFLEYYNFVSPTIITGWNTSRFDIPYLIRRLNRVMGSSAAKKLSPIGLIKFNQRRQTYSIAGVNSLDYLTMYKKFTYTQQPTYRLDAIGEFEVKIKKTPYTGTLQELYENDLSKFVEYNVNDVKIVVEIDNKKKLIELVRQICHVGHVPYEDYEMSSRWIEGTIVTYLHRKEIICPNKPIDGREQMNARMENDDDGFVGAYVKEPLPGLYKWIYSLDLQSLYPSVVMSLNISPETKAGRVLDWDYQKHLNGEISHYLIDTFDAKQHKLTKDEFSKFMKESKFYISSNGILYISKTEKIGIIPEILDKWFANRVEYRKMMQNAIAAGDSEKADYWDKRQHVQKIFLNSIYGVLGLPIFRFYDLDNALAVTASGQDIIKNSAKLVNVKYQQELHDAEDHCIYIDTDSLYFSSFELFHQTSSEEEILNKTIELAKLYEKRLNQFYNVLVNKLFFIFDTHRLVIRGESVARRGVWIAKKRYALHKVYDLEKSKKTDELVIKGLDVVRSSFPKAFSKFMSDTLESILKDSTKEQVDQNILALIQTLPTLPYTDVARNTSIQNMNMYDDKKIKDLTLFKKGTPMHVKSCIIYNRLLKKFGLDKKYSLITSGDKIKYVILKQNPYSIDTIAFKGYDDPQEIINFIKQYIDTTALFEAELENKLEDFYAALNWGSLPTKINQNADQFFTF